WGQRSRITALRASIRATRGCESRSLLLGPDLGADLRPTGVGPDALPLVALVAEQRQPAVAAGHIGDGDELVVSDAGAVVLGAADIAGDLEGVGALLDADSAGILRSTRVRAGDVIFADRVCECRCASEDDSQTSGNETAHSFAPEIEGRTPACRPCVCVSS